MQQPQNLAYIEHLPIELIASKLATAHQKENTSWTNKITKKKVWPETEEAPEA